MKSSEMSKGRNASKKLGNHCTRWTLIESQPLPEARLDFLDFAFDLLPFVFDLFPLLFLDFVRRFLDAERTGVSRKRRLTLSSMWSTNESRC